MANLENNADKIADIALQKFIKAQNQRVLIAIAGAPGSGKSSLAERAVEIINQKSAITSALFPMDGYHYDNTVLEAMGRLQFKGAIDTFDAHGLRHMLQRLKANEDDNIAIPIFDRAIEIARAGGRLIPQSTNIIICEGNYLLADTKPWGRLKEIFDFTIFVDVDKQELRRRLQTRWHNYGLDEVDVNRKVEDNDLPNGLYIIKTAVEPDLYLKN